MKKRLLIALIALLMIPVVIWAAELNNVTSKGVDGNLVFYDQSGNVINTWDAANRKVTIPSGSTIAIENGGKITGLNLGAIATHVYSLAEAWVMSTAETICSFLSISSGSGAISIIAPDTAGKVYIVRNASLSGTVTIKISGGTGVSVAVGKTAVVMHNGSDYVRVTADASH
ncbi:MAG: hypothetical protein ABFD12_00260 [Syntrophorhabdus sp.]